MNSRSIILVLGCVYSLIICNINANEPSVQEKHIDPSKITDPVPPAVIANKYGDRPFGDKYLISAEACPFFPVQFSLFPVSGDNDSDSKILQLCQDKVFAGFSLA